jgi:hypothetical protein
MVEPIFILSLPRSGSTLLQRLLLVRDECATLGEPSLLLRFLGDRSKIARYTSYRDRNVEMSMQDMRAEWDGFDDAYSKGVRNLILDIYEHLASGRRYFIDKTPRYTLIADEIFNVFPDAKFLILWRHPLAVAASITSTFFKDVWQFDDFILDLTVGLDRLFEFSQTHADRVCAIRYEDLVSHQEETLVKVGQYLDLNGLEAVVRESLPQGNGGRLGDPTGVKKYQKLSADSCDQWLQNYSNWYRINWAKEYFQDPRAHWLNELGYTLPDEIVRAPKHWLEGFRERKLVHEKLERADRRRLRAFNRDHISPYSN